jgi:hypothetical protein
MTPQSSGELFPNLDRKVSAFSIKNNDISGSSLEKVFLYLDGEGKDVKIRSDRLEIGSSI